MWLPFLACAEDPETRWQRAREERDPEALGELCEQGRVEACALAVAVVPEADPRRASWHERACDAGSVESCLRRSTEPGDAFRAKACALGDGGSCLAAGDAARTRGDRAKAAELYGVRCAASPDDAACLLADRMKDPAPPQPTGDPAAVSEALWARCQADEGLACLYLSEHVARGGPPPADGRPVEWLRDQACDLQVVYACAPHAW